MSEFNLISDILAQIPEEDVPEREPGDILEFLAEKYGSPETVLSDSRDTQLIFNIGDKRIAILRNPITSILTGFIILAQAAPPPCPNPRVLGAITVTGSGSGSPPAVAFAEAMVVFIMSYNAASRTFCSVCRPSPPCVCDIAATGAPSINVSTRIKWKWFIPVGVVTTVTISLPIRARCV